MICSISFMSNHSASWRMPTPKEMEKQARQAVRKQASGPAGANSAEMPLNTGYSRSHRRSDQYVCREVVCHRPLDHQQTEDLVEFAIVWEDQTTTLRLSHRTPLLKGQRENIYSNLILGFRD